MNHRLNESMNHGTDEPMNQRINESMNQWTNESLIQWINETVAKRMPDGWLDGWIDGHFSGLLLLCAASQLALVWLLQPSSSLRAAGTIRLTTSNSDPAEDKTSTRLKNYFWRNCCAAFSNVQLQSHLPGASQHHSCFTVRSGAHAFSPSRLQAQKAGASHQLQKTFAQRWQCELDQANPALVRTCQFLFGDFYMKSSSRFSLVHILPTSSSKSAPRLSVFTVWFANQALATVLYTFCRQLSQIEARSRKNKDPTSATPEATLP